MRFPHALWKRRVERVSAVRRRSTSSCSGTSLRTFKRTTGPSLYRDFWIKSVDSRLIPAPNAQHLTRFPRCDLTHFPSGSWLESRQCVPCMSSLSANLMQAITSADTHDPDPRLVATVLSNPTQAAGMPQAAAEHAGERRQPAGSRSQCATIDRSAPIATSPAGALVRQLTVRQEIWVPGPRRRACRRELRLVELMADKASVEVPP